MAKTNKAPNAKKKGTAKKAPVKSAGEKAGESVNEVAEVLDKLSKQPELDQWEIDEDVRAAISELGKAQAKYQQLRIIRKSRGLRRQIKLLRIISNDFK